MSIKKLLLLLLILVILNSFSVYAQVCGGNIAVSTNMSVNLNCAGNGVRIIASNIIFDCKGFNITGSQVANSYGIKVDTVQNVTVRNCYVQNFTYGILLDHSNDSFVLNNTANDNLRPGFDAYGIHLNYSDNNTVINNTAKRNDKSGIELFHSDYNNITKNFVDFNDDYGILLGSASQHNHVINNTATRQRFFGGIGIRTPLVQRNNFNVIMYNKAYNNSAGGFSFGDLEQCNITQNVAYNNSGSGFTFLFPVADRNNISNNTAYNNSASGFSFSSADLNNITNNKAYNNADGIKLFGCNRNVLRNNQIYNNSQDGFKANNDFRNQYLNNTVYNNTGDGFDISVSGTGLLVANNTVYYNKQNGLRFQNLAPFGPDTIFNNDVYNNTLSGILFAGSGNATVSNNTIRFNGLFGFHLQNSGPLNITLNTVLNHTFSINLSQNSDNNTIYNNYFGDLPFADATCNNNNWNIAKTWGINIINGLFLGGNFWRFYNGTDIDKDGLGDTFLPWQGLTNQIVNGGDFHPLMQGAWSAQMIQEILNSTFGTNFTFENLTCYGNGVTTTANNITYHGYFFKNGIPQFNILNRSFYNGSSSSNDEAFGVAVDSNDSMIIAGKMNGDWAVVKYDKNGNYLWNWTGPSVSINAQDVAVDTQDNILVTGNTFISGREYAWTVKLDSNGNHLWNRTISGITPFWKAQGRGVTSDSNDSVIITGVRHEAGCTVCWDILLAKYDTNGNLQWSIVFGNLLTQSDEGEAVATDSQDNIALVGRWSNRGAIFKFNPAGAQIWNVTGLYASASASNLYGVDTDSQDNVVAGGEFWVGGAVNVTVFKYTSGGVQLWNASTGGASSDRGDGVVVDYEDNIFLSGATSSFNVTGSNIYLVKYLFNGTKAWQYLGDFGNNERGWSIDTNSWGEPVIGGRQSPVSGGRRMLLVNYKGFFDYNQTPGVLKNISGVNSSLTSPGELWRCDLQAFDGNNLSATQKSNDVLIRSPTPANIQCSRNIPNNFMNCSNLSYFDNITQVRVSCAGAASATFNLTNLYDGVTFFVNSTTTVAGGFFVLDNSDVQILDSGNWSLGVSCNYGTAIGNATSYFFIPFGNITNAQMLSTSITVTNGQSFNISTSIGCTGGECVNLTVALDPILPVTNLTNPTGAVHRVYADSQFIYAASEDTNTYVWNKTGLGLFATLSSSAALRTVWADSQYIYTGGTNNQIEVWNRTDLVTPFANVANISTNGTVYAIRSDNNYIYAGGGITWWYGVIGVYNKTTFASVANLTNATDIVRSMDLDSNYLYAADHSCNLWVYNISSFSSTALAVNTGCAQLKDVSVDTTYISASGQLGPGNVFTQIWNKSNNAQVFGWNDTTGNYYGAAVHAGGTNFAYHGGHRNGWWSDGWIGDINKSSWTIASIFNITNQVIKTIYCDASYLYAGTINTTGATGMVMLFNNPCITGPPPVPISVSGLSITPTNFPVTTNNVRCKANVTTPGTVANVTFNVTFPDGSSTLLSSTNVGNTYFSQGFTVSSILDHNCTINANNTNGTSASRTVSFFGGNKGIIPMNAGSPFYTTSQNPRNGSHQACLNSLIPGQSCNSSWIVVANGNSGDTWAFFSIYTGSSINTSKINVTILGGPSPTPSGGGGGGGAARSWQQIESELQEEVCIEAWLCDPWADCEFGETTRACVDMNACGTEKNKPPELRHCKVEEIIVEEPSLLKDVNIKEIQQEEFKPTVVKGPEEKPSLLTSRNALRAALIAVVLGALIYIFALSRFLRARRVKPKKASMKEEDFPVVSKKVPVKKIKPKAPVQKPKPKAPVKNVQPKKKPEKLPKDTEGLLNELNKL